MAVGDKSTREGRTEEQRNGHRSTCTAGRGNRSQRDGCRVVDIRLAVQRLQEHQIETCESCEGGPDHAYPEPTVAFYGTPEAGWRAVAVCLSYGLPVRSLRRVWDIVEANEPTGPHWEITFRQRMI